MTQPVWTPQNQLLFVSDRTGWWNIYQENGGQVVIDRQYTVAADADAAAAAAYCCCCLANDHSPSSCLKANNHLHSMQPEALQIAALCIHTHSKSIDLVPVVMAHTVSMQHLQVLWPQSNAVLPY